jgi:hypothetical protein
MISSNDDIAAELPFPLKGVDKRLSFSAQPSLTTPLGRNVRAHEPRTLRAKGGSRPGLSRFVDQSLGGPLQGLFLVATTDAGAPWFRALAESPPALPDGYTADPSTAGPQALWGTGTGEHTTQTPPPPARGGPGGGEYGGGGPGTQYQSRVPPNRVRTGGTGYPPYKNAPRQEIPVVTDPTVTDVTPTWPLNHPGRDVTDPLDSFPLPVVTDTRTGRTVPGGWIFTPVAGTTLVVGTQTITANFTPDDNKYTAVKTTFDLPVKAVVPVTSQKKTGSGPVLIDEPVTVRTGDLLVAVVLVDGATPTLKDNRGLTWSEAVTRTTGTLRLSLHYAVVPSAAFGGSTSGTVVVTVEPSVSSSYVGLCLGAYRGVNGSTTLHDSDGATGTGGTTQPSSTVNADGDLVVSGHAGASGAAVSATAAGTMAVLRQETFSTATGPKIALGDDTEGTAPTAGHKLTLGASLDWAAVMASFRKA